MMRASVTPGDADGSKLLPRPRLADRAVLLITLDAAAAAACDEVLELVDGVLARR